MFLLLPISGFILFVIFELVSHNRQHPWGWRASVMMACLAWGSVVVAMTEVLNLGQRLDAASLAIGWGIVLVALISVLAWLIHRAGSASSVLAKARKEAGDWMRQQGLVTWVLLGILGIQAISLAIVAFAFAPNTYETMTYHLPRVLHWLQNHSLMSIASPNVRENYFPPFAEFVFMHQMALAGNDRYVNLIQWSAFLLMVVGVSALAGELGASQNTQIAAALLSAGIPMAVLQATTARNDLVLSTWLLSLVCFGLRWAKTPGSWQWAAGAGISLGLALLTKATAFIYALPLGILIAVLVIKKGGAWPAFTRGGIVMLIALALNLPHVSRNWALYGDPISTQQRVGTSSMSPPVFVSDVLRNAAMHVPMDCKPPLSFLNRPGQWLLGGLGQLHRLTGLSPTDPRTTWGFVNIFDRSLGCIYDEHYSGNPLHALLILATCLGLLLLPRENSAARWLAVALIVGFLLLSLIVRWQVWGTHLQLPLFVLWSPIIALTLGRVRQMDVARPVAVLAVILSFLWIYNNRMRPLSGLISGTAPSRDEQYFQYAKVFYPDFNSMTEAIARTGCDRVGLHTDSLVLEYPVWIMLREKGFKGIIEHIDVTNETGVYADANFVPCAIISQEPRDDYAAVLADHPFGDFHLYLNDTATAP